MSESADAIHAGATPAGKLWRRWLLASVAALVASALLQVELRAQTAAPAASQAAAAAVGPAAAPPAPLNCFSLTKKVVYENEEFNLLQHALNIEDGIESLRYNKVIIATDADVDGMHIRLLLMTFFLQFFPELVKANHVFILETPLFRVRNKKETIYCYSDQERQAAIAKLGAKPEITRFKGLGEISPDEFGNFIGDEIRLQPVLLGKEGHIANLLEFYMGKNTPDRQDFIIDNLKIELDNVEAKDVKQEVVEEVTETV